jgi:hypothetical protein
MSLSELAAANALLDEPRALAARYREEGCLLIREAIDPRALSEIADQAASVLERWGVADRSDGMRWTGAPISPVDATELQSVPALLELGDRAGAAYEALAAVAAQAFACPMQIWPGARLLLGLPGDPSRATPPHQDSRAVDWIGDYRRFWIALGEIPFGDGGLALATGSHLYRRLPLTELIDDRWHSAAMTSGDLFLFDLNLVHRSLPATSDRIRVAITMIASAQWDPRPVMSEDPLQPGTLSLGLCEHEALARPAS